MLFLLTDNVQIGKTRWLESLVAELTGRGVSCTIYLYSWLKSMSSTCSEGMAAKPDREMNP